MNKKCLFNVENCPCDGEVYECKSYGKLSLEYRELANSDKKYYFLTYDMVGHNITRMFEDFDIEKPEQLLIYLYDIRKNVREIRNQ